MMRSLALVFCVAVLIAFLPGCGEKEKLIPFPLKNGTNYTKNKVIGADFGIVLI